MNFANRINYSIDNIERSIVADTPIGTRYSDSQKKKLYQEKETQQICRFEKDNQHQPHT